MQLFYCSTFEVFSFLLQVSWDTVAIQAHVNISIVVWDVTVWSTMRPNKGSASVWITANHTTNLCVAQMGNCTRTTVSSIGLLVSEVTRLPSCTARNAIIKVRAHVLLGVLVVKFVFIVA